MNNRINELFGKALDKAVPETWTEISPAQLLKIKDKFAELIVKECLDVASHQKEWVENQVVFDDRDKFWNRARIQQSQHIVDKIKEHFGVEGSDY